MYRTPATLPLSLMSHANGENNIDSCKEKKVATLSNSTIKVKVDSLQNTPHISGQEILDQFCPTCHILQKIKVGLCAHHALCVSVYPTPSINI
jgi:hypothetical protein